MLQEKLTQCLALMDEVRQNKGTVAANLELAKCNNTFFGGVTDFFIPNMDSYLVVKNNMGDVFPEEVRSKMNECIKAAKEAFSTQKIKNASEAHSFRANAVDLRDLLKTSWSEYVEGYNRELLDELGVLRLVYPDKAKVNGIIADIKAIDTWPVKQDLFDNYKRAEKKARGLLKDIHFDSEIDLFLRKVRDGKATFLDLTDPIIQWIRENHFEENIKLSIV